MPEKRNSKFFFLEDFFFWPTDRSDFWIGLRPETNYFLRLPLFKLCTGACRNFYLFAPSTSDTFSNVLVFSSSALGPNPKRVPRCSENPSANLWRLIPSNFLTSLFSSCRQLHTCLQILSLLAETSQTFLYLQMW